MSKNMSLKAFAIFAALTTTGVANAEIFQYDTEFGGSQTRLTIDTERGTASYVGGGTNVTYSGADLSNFDSSDQNILYTFSSVSGVVDNRGNILTPVVNGQTGQARLRFIGNQSDIWSAALNEDGRLINFDIFSGNLTPVAPPVNSSTSTGGLGSTGGTSSSTGGAPTGGSTGGGTDVPAPGAIGLLGLGIAGLAFGRRRRKTK